MAVSNAQLIRNAFSSLGIYGVGDSIEPEHSEFALNLLNSLMSDWKQDGVDLEYYAQSMSELGAACPIPEHAELAVQYYLAMAIAPHFGKSYSQEFSAQAAQYYSRLTRDAVTERSHVAKMDHLPRGEGVRAGFDIRTGK